MTKKLKEYPLIDATEPNLLEETFDYNLPPLIRFDGPIIEYIDGKPVEVRSAARSRPATSSSPTRRSATASRPGRRTPSTRWSRSTTCWRSWAAPTA